MLALAVFSLVKVTGMLSNASTSWAWAWCAEARRGRTRREALMLNRGCGNSCERVISRGLLVRVSEGELKRKFGCG